MSVYKMKQKNQISFKIWFPTVVRSKLLLFFFHHLYKKEKDNEYDKVIHWILNDAHL